MDFPINPTFFGHELNAHVLLEILAFIVGFRFYVYRKRKLGESDTFSKQQRLIILVAAATGALIFSRVIGALENRNEWINASNPWLYLYGVKTIAGGFIGGWLFVEIAKYFMKIKSSSGDVMVYPIILAVVIGRLGCFSQGVYDMTHGNETTWITGMDLGDGLIRHPLSLYEIVVVIFIGLWMYFAQRRRAFPDGWQFKSFMLLYLFYRFIAEYMKPHFPLAFGMTSIQLAIIVTYIFNIRATYQLIKSS